LGLEIADAYQQLGLLKEAMAADKDRVAAVLVYRKAADVLVTVSTVSPEDTTAAQRLARLNQRIVKLGGESVVVQVGQGTQVGGKSSSTSLAFAESPSSKKPELAPQTATKVEVEKSTSGENLDSKSSSASPPPSANISPAELREAEDNIASVAGHVKTADDGIEPIRQSLAANGQILSPELQSAAALMHSRLDRARRHLAAGDLAAVKDDLTAADAFANKVLRAVGR
jgi:hypothetical protein